MIRKFSTPVDISWKRTTQGTSLDSYEAMATLISSFNRASIEKRRLPLDDLTQVSWVLSVPSKQPPSTFHPARDKLHIDQYTRFLERPHNFVLRGVLDCSLSSSFHKNVVDPDHARDCEGAQHDWHNFLLVRSDYLPAFILALLVKSRPTSIRSPESNYPVILGERR